MTAHTKALLAGIVVLACGMVPAAPAQDTSWSIDPPPAELVVDSSPTVVWFAVNNLPTGADAKFLKSTLQEGTTKRILGGIDVAKDPTQSFRYKLTLDAKGAKPGQYRGNVTLSSSEDGSTRPFELTVYVSSLEYKALGAMLVFLGLLVWFFATVLAEGLAARANAESAVGAVRQGLDGLLTTHQQARKTSDLPLANIQRRLEELTANLDIEQLDQKRLLPPRMPYWPQPFDAEKLRAHLAAAAAEKGIVAEIVGVGLAGVPGLPDAGQHAGAYDRLDRLAVTRDELAEVREAVAKILTPTQEMGGFAAAPAAAGAPRALRSEREIQLQLAAVGRWRVTAWFAVAIAGGIFALIIPNPGFGTPTDLAKAFFWGLGLPAAGTTLLSSGPGRITEIFKIQTGKVA